MLGCACFAPFHVLMTGKSGIFIPNMGNNIPLFSDIKGVVLTEFTTTCFYRLLFFQLFWHAICMYSKKGVKLWKKVEENYLF